MESKESIFVKLLLILHLSVLCVSQDFDFYYFVQQVRIDSVFNIAEDHSLILLVKNLFFFFFLSPK